MHVKALRELPYLIPVFLLALCFSPNFTSSNIQQAALSCLVIAAPIIAWSRSLAREDGLPSLSDPRVYLILVFLLLGTWWNLDDAVFIGSLVLIIATVFLLKGQVNLTREVFNALIFFVICYLQLNGYGLTQIISLRFAILLIIPLTYPLLYIRRYELRFGYLMFIIAFVIVSLRMDTLNYVLALIPVIIPRLIMELRKAGKMGLTDMATGILLTGFCIYYFLFANHVWQALTGGL